MNEPAKKNPIDGVYVFKNEDPAQSGERPKTSPSMELRAMGVSTQAVTLAQNDLEEACGKVLKEKLGAVVAQVIEERVAAGHVEASEAVVAAMTSAVVARAVPIVAKEVSNRARNPIVLAVMRSLQNNLQAQAPKNAFEDDEPTRKLRAVR